MNGGRPFHVGLLFGLPGLLASKILGCGLGIWAGTTRGLCSQNLTCPECPGWKPIPLGKGQRSVPVTRWEPCLKEGPRGRVSMSSGHTLGMGVATPKGAALNQCQHRGFKPRSLPQIPRYQSPGDRGSPRIS